MRHNHVQLLWAVADAMPDAECITFRGRRFTYGQLAERINRFAHVLLDHDITIRRPLTGLSPVESAHDHVALYLHNGNEYIEGMFGACAARAASFNVNYRYVEDELAYLFDDAQAAAIVYHQRFAPTLGAVIDRLERQPLLVQVADGSGHDLLPGAIDYETALAAASPARPSTEPDPDDLYLLYTGGTTGLPKGVMWRQADILESTVGPSLPPKVFDAATVTEAGEAIVEDGLRPVVLPLPPLMHASGQWIMFAGLYNAGRLVFPDVVERLDPVAVWDVIDKERVTHTTLVGDAFARPLLDELEQGGRDGSSLSLVVVGGAVTTVETKTRLLDAIPGVTIADGAGSSESGGLLTNASTAQAPPTTGTFTPGPAACVVDEERSRILPPSDLGVGWLARRGLVPIGYLGDAEKTASTFLTIDGERLVIPGDRARWVEDGTIELLGRDSVTINSGGEKIFAEEVELALLGHPAVVDVIVVGRPNERWGNEVVAVVELEPGTSPTDDELTDVASRQLARYKLPKAILRVPSVVRGPSGKADYAWARELASSEVTKGGGHRPDAERSTL